MFSMNVMPIDNKATNSQGGRLVIEGGDDSRKPDFFEVPPEENLRVHGFEKSNRFDVGGYSPWMTCYAQIPAEKPDDPIAKNTTSNLEDAMSKFILYGRRAGVLFAPATDKWELEDPHRIYGVYVSEFAMTTFKSGLVAILNPRSEYVKTKEGFEKRKKIDESLVLRRIFKKQPMVQADEQMRQYLASEPRVVAINLISRAVYRFSHTAWSAYVLERK